ncbi:MAG: hypothetical protein M3Q68_07540, partial [Actinomycetota bacterium]|nr:hypothetical protein [Actinomycetota bacterium]
MLLLVTILLVLVAAVTLLIGIFSDNLALIFISIGASALAAIVLAVLSQMGKRKSKAAEAGGAEPLPKREETDAKAVTEPAAAGKEAPTQSLPAQPAAGAPGALPIDGYDALRVNEILPRLVGLDLDELEEVAQHEEARKNRTTVLNRIDQLMDELEAAGSEDATPAVTDDVVEEAVAAIEEMGEPVVAMAESAPASPSESSSDDGFPIAGYDDLTETDLIPMFDDLDADQLEAVADREEAGQNRDGVLDAIDDRLDILEGIVPAPAKAAPAPKLPAKRATASPAKKAAAARTPAKKATAAAG